MKCKKILEEYYYYTPFIEYHRTIGLLQLFYPCDLPSNNVFVQTTYPID